MCFVTSDEFLPTVINFEDKRVDNIQSCKVPFEKAQEFTLSANKVPNFYYNNDSTPGESLENKAYKIVAF